MPSRMRAKRPDGVHRREMPVSHCEPPLRGPGVLTAAAHNRRASCPAGSLIKEHTPEAPQQTEISLHLPSEQRFRKKRKGPEPFSCVCMASTHSAAHMEEAGLRKAHTPCLENQPVLSSCKI